MPNAAVVFVASHRLTSNAVKVASRACFARSLRLFSGAATSEIATLATSEMTPSTIGEATAEKSRDHTPGMPRLRTDRVQQAGIRRRLAGIRDRPIAARRLKTAGCRDRSKAGRSTCVAVVTCPIAR